MLWFRMYSYSPTSIILWLYENVPHALLLTVLLTGIVTLTCMIAVSSCCGFRVLWTILRLSYRVSAWAFVHLARWARGAWNAYQQAREACKRRNRRTEVVDNRLTAGRVVYLPAVPTGSVLTNAPLNNRTDEAEPIEPAAFRPRRTRRPSSRRARVASTPA